MEQMRESFELRRVIVDFGSASLGDCFSHQTRRVSRFPGDPHLYNIAIIAQRANSRSYTRLTSRLAVQNNPYMRPASLPLFSIADQAAISSVLPKNLLH